MALIEKIIGVTDADGHKIIVIKDDTFGTGGIILDCDYHGQIALDKESAKALCELIKKELEKNG